LKQGAWRRHCLSSRSVPGDDRWKYKHNLPLEKKEEEENGKKIDLCLLGECGSFEKPQGTKGKIYMESKI